MLRQLSNEARKKTKKNSDRTVAKGKPATRTGSTSGDATPLKRPAAQEVQSVEKGDLVFVRPKMSGPTNEATPRCELCGITNENKKCHIFSMTKQHHFIVMTRVFEEMKKRSMTKKEALEFRDSLLKDL